MARGELYLSSLSPNGAATLSLLQSMTTSTEGGQASFGPATTHGAMTDITMTFSKSPIIIPIPDQKPMGFDLNIIESWTIVLNTTWYDGIGGTTYNEAEEFFTKDGWEDTMKPYKLTWGVKEYYVQLDRWSVTQRGGYGDTIDVSISFMVVASE